MKHNIEAEANILGAILNNNDLICDAINVLEPVDFYNSRHQILYGNMKQMYEDGKTVDVTTLAEYLGKELAVTGGITYISQLLDSNLVRNIKPYVEIVKEKSELRKLETNLHKALKQIEEEKNTEGIISFLQEKTLNIKVSSNEETGDINQPLADFLEDLERRYKGGGDIQGIKTHISKLDFLTGGLQKQEMIIVAARPSMGKSVLAINVAANVSLRSQKKVAMFSLEMNNISLIKRMVSNLASIDSYNLRDGKLDDKQWVEVSKLLGLLNTPNLKLFERTMSLNAIYSMCKKLKIQNGLDVVIIDYIGLIDGIKGENRNQEISKASRRLKLMAKELDLTVIALSQLSRAPEARKDHRPMLSDLRESGSIEQDADLVIFLYRDEYYNADSEDKGIVELIVAKQRDGKLGGIKCGWFPQYQRICNLDYTYAGKY